MPVDNTRPPTKVTSYPSGTRRPRDFDLPGIVGEETLAGPDGVLRGTGVVELTQSSSGLLIDGEVPISPGQRVTVVLDYDVEGSSNPLGATDQIPFELSTADDALSSIQVIREAVIRMEGVQASRRYDVSFVSSSATADTPPDQPLAGQRYFQIRIGTRVNVFSIKVKFQYHIHPLNT